MNKPVLLLVDDDRAVLGALGAELTPVFAELCRIEAFGDARAVLEALPRWTEEKRSIAVAIVDQRMPGMTGVELLAALRGAVTQCDGAAVGSADPVEAGTSFHPARHMGAILLTGYAGLDSAMAAKNEGSAGRYLEKPWDGLQLCASIRKQIAEWAGSSNHDEFLIWRPLASPDELVEHMRLRHVAYQDAWGGAFILNDSKGLNLDEFETTSWHYGLFHVTRGTSRMMGTHRHVPSEPCPSSEIAERAFQQLGLDVPTRVNRSLPMLSYLPRDSRTRHWLDDMLDAREKLMEPTRATVTQAIQSMPANAPFRHLTECATAESVCVRGDETVVISCTPIHGVAYRRMLGFTPIPGTPAEGYPTGTGDHYVALRLSESDLPPPVSARCQEISARLRRCNGAACRCVVFPDCLGGPYGTGDFAATDLWCPELAHRVCGAEHVDLGGAGGS